MIIQTTREQEWAVNPPPPNVCASRERERVPVCRVQLWHGSRGRLRGSGGVFMPDIYGDVGIRLQKRAVLGEM